MDITQELRDTENALRDFIATVLTEKLGDNWVDQCGVSAERVQKWRERKAAEEKRQEAGVVEERLLYYADFYDIKTILKKHWSHFSVALGELRSMEVYLSDLERLRDPDAHRRELLPHQKHLISGIGGEIRTRLVRFRSKQETAADYFPRIESARDSLGNIWTPECRRGKYVSTGLNLRPGDRLDFVVTASDPLGQELEYSLQTRNIDRDPWQNSNSISLVISEQHVTRIFSVVIFVKSRRKYHTFSEYDDSVEFIYTVLPPVKADLSPLPTDSQKNEGLPFTLFPRPSFFRRLFRFPSRIQNNGSHDDKK
jgi:hypothetical protein